MRLAATAFGRFDFWVRSFALAAAAEKHYNILSPLDNRLRRFDVEASVSHERIETRRFSWFLALVEPCRSAS